MTSLPLPLLSYWHHDPLMTIVEYKVMASGDKKFTLYYENSQPVQKVKWHFFDLARYLK